ncbi:ArsR/SmtB family transcription factor [Cryptosporangium aurantiacum]|uniref:Transcriptional regulator, ArsR family n=1 Tax=Cryptosporangium aurantiacum TaxID=134849 RepID=A0A1M7TUU2_9ACTN|nr:metalloregulator ArsR/SmtB family transcription factor [Cryptosporangium aurantiacum]SHN74509.1 transcriptional regulator, ArsR family [Cryptosporangium aurantiacum]
MSVWEALGDPVRREILAVLGGGEATVGTLAARFPISRPAVSRHLRVLREAGLVRSEVHGQERVYRLHAAPLAEVDAWLRNVTPVPRSLPGPASRLDALSTELRRGRKTRAKEMADDNRSAG